MKLLLLLCLIVFCAKQSQALNALRNLFTQTPVDDVVEPIKLVPVLNHGAPAGVAEEYFNR